MDAGERHPISLPRGAGPAGRDPASDDGLMVSSLAAAIVALAVLTVLPGPDVAVVTRVALADGRSAALRTATGIVSGLLAWGALTVAGLAAIFAASATAYAVVKLAGAAYLVA